MYQRGVRLLQYTVLKGGDGYREAVEKSIGVT